MRAEPPPSLRVRRGGGLRHARAALMALALAMLEATATATPSCPAGLQASAELRFAELFVQPVGPSGLQPGPRLLALAGQCVQITGYVVQQVPVLPGRLLLSPYPVQLGDDDDGLADDLAPATVFVRLPAGVEAPPGGSVVQVAGLLALGPQDEPDGRVSHLRVLAGSSPCAPPGCAQ